MKKEKLQTRKEKLERINRKLKRKKYTAILLALFTLGVNAFAWFVFSTQVGAEVHGSVASWDIELTNSNNQLVNNVLIEVNMKPGMPDFSQTYQIHNQGEVDATFTYEVDSLSILGRNITLTGINDLDDYLENYYPFSITISSNKSVIPSLDTANFTVTVEWDFEDSTKYHALNNVYDFDPGFTYYQLSNGNYVEFNATSSNYLTNRSSLFLQRDDADTYFGSNCKTYEDTSNAACLQIGITLAVQQKQDSQGT